MYKRPSILHLLACGKGYFMLRPPAMHVPPWSYFVCPRIAGTLSPTSEYVPVSFVSSVDFPTEGKPTKPTRASPTLFTSKPGSKRQVQTMSGGKWNDPFFIPHTCTSLHCVDHCPVTSPVQCLLGYACVFRLPCLSQQPQTNVLAGSKQHACQGMHIWVDIQHIPRHI